MSGVTDNFRFAVDNCTDVQNSVASNMWHQQVVFFEIIQRKIMEKMISNTSIRMGIVFVYVTIWIEYAQWCNLLQHQRPAVVIRQSANPMIWRCFGTNHGSNGVENVVSYCRKCCVISVTSMETEIRNSGTPGTAFPSCQHARTNALRDWDLLHIQALLVLVARGCSRSLCKCKRTHYWSAHACTHAHAITTRLSSSSSRARARTE